MTCVCGHSLAGHSTTHGCIAVDLNEFGGSVCTCNRYLAKAPTTVGRHPFNTVGAEMNHGPFWYNDDDVWEAWLNEIAEAIAEHDPWALLVMRPDMDMVIVDVFDGWRDRVKRFNGRTVWCLRPVGWEP